MATITPPLKWYGGKFYLAQRLVAMMPPHKHYVEPFAGGLAVLLAKDPAGVSEVANDAHAELVGFYRVLRDPEAFAEFVRRAALHPFSRREWGAARDFLKTGGGTPVERALAFFVLCRQSFAGRMGGFAPSPKMRTRSGMNEQVSAWLGAVDGLAVVHARLKRVYVEHGPAADVIRRHDGPETLFYLDPPYVHGTRTGGPAYEHEMTDEEHRDLITQVRRCSAKAMISGYANPMYDDLLADWNRHEFDMPNNAAGAGKGKRRMTECVWCNFDATKGA